MAIHLKLNSASKRLILIAMSPFKIVNAPYVGHVVHITPSNNIESYAHHYNNSDIAANTRKMYMSQ